LIKAKVFKNLTKRQLHLHCDIIDKTIYIYQEFCQELVQFACFDSLIGGDQGNVFNTN